MAQFFYLIVNFDLAGNMDIDKKNNILTAMIEHFSEYRCVNNHHWLGDFEPKNHNQFNIEMLRHFLKMAKEGSTYYERMKDFIATNLYDIEYCKMNSEYIPEEWLFNNFDDDKIYEVLPREYCPYCLNLEKWRGK